MINFCERLLHGCEADDMMKFNMPHRVLGGHNDTAQYDSIRYPSHPFILFSSFSSLLLGQQILRDFSVTFLHIPCPLV
jgi:hypothetical protein